MEIFFIRQQEGYACLTIWSRCPLYLLPRRLHAATKGCRFHRGWVAGLYLHLKIASADSVDAPQSLLTLHNVTKSLPTLRFPLLRKTFLLFADAWRVPAILKNGGRWSFLMLRIL